MSSRRRPSHPHSADIEFTASLQADELRFDESPETEIVFSGHPGHESAAGSDRTNLPEEVEPGVTYRDVRVDYRLATRLTGAATRPPSRPASGGVSSRGRRRAGSIVDSGSCAICGKPIDPDEAERDMETGSLAHASCIEKERASGD